MPDITVIICTHNPREDYFRRVLEALRAQTLSKHQWELLVIDNQSSKPLASDWDLSWHPGGRHVREEELGLTAARLRGIQESNSRVLVFVDDDNVLATDYLERILRLNEEKPWVGVWTAGNIEAEFEEQPADWLQPFLRYLALASNSREVWSNDYHSGLLPIGAGMSVRSSVGLHYSKQVRANPIYRKLDRSGNSLFAAGDTNLGLCACDIGLACGQAPNLRVLHLVPRRRVRPNYLIRLARDVTCSQQLLYLEYGLTKPNRPLLAWQIACRLLAFPLDLLRHGPGMTLLRVTQRLADWMAIGYYHRLRESGGTVGNAEYQRS